MSQTRKPEFQEENKTQVSRLQARIHFPSRLVTEEGSDCGGDGKPPKMSEQRCGRFGHCDLVF